MLDSGLPSNMLQAPHGMLASIEGYLDRDAPTGERDQSRRLHGSFSQFVAVKARADLEPGPWPPKGVSAGEGTPTGVDGDSSPTSSSSRCLGFFDSFFSSLLPDAVLSAGPPCL